MLNSYLDITPEVSKAIAGNIPVVALESTIISHGMPYPKNVETALNVEKIIRENGAVPATIAILQGRLKVGLTREEIEYLAKGKEVVKASRRDILFIIAKKLDGATTVAATMIIANLAGIKVFATGGIGGVHRGAQQTFDISADLQELAQTNVAVVCAGAKSILDIGLTLEYLETHGVPVVGFGTNEMPAFYRVDSPAELAQAIKAKWDLGLNGGIVVANPIPEQYQMDYDVISRVVDEAVQEAEFKGIKGKETTPFLLAKVKEITEGESLEANIQLVYNNAKVGAQLAVELSKELGNPRL